MSLSYLGDFVELENPMLPTERVIIEIWEKKTKRKIVWLLARTKETSHGWIMLGFIEYNFTYYLFNSLGY